MVARFWLLLIPSALVLTGIEWRCSAEELWKGALRCAESQVRLFTLDELPEKPTDPERALVAFLSALSWAGRPARFGSIPTAEDGCRKAYGYLSRAVRQRVSLEQFKNSLSGVGKIRPLKILPANYGDDTDPAWIPRYFVEVERLEECELRGEVKSVITYYAGFYTLTKEEGTFRVKSWDMKPEDFISRLGGHQPWRYDPEEMAAQHVLTHVFHGKGPLSGPVTLLQRKEDFAEVRVGKETGGYSVYLARLENGEWMPIYLTGGPASFPGPSPPEKRAMRIAFVVYQRGNQDIYTMRGDGSGVRRLTVDPANDLNPCWSPDGTRIAFASDRTGNQDIYVMDADSSNVKRVAATPGSDHSPAWSPDGSRVAFVADGDDAEHRGLYIADVGTEAPRRLTPAGMWAACPAWTPDAKRILFRSGRQLWAVNADGSGLERLVWLDELDEDVAFAPDGQRAAVVNLNGQEGKWDIYLLDIGRSDFHRITFDGLQKQQPRWVTDYVLLFCLHKGGKAKLYWLDVSSGGMAPVAAGDGNEYDGSVVMPR